MLGTNLAPSCQKDVNFVTNLEKLSPISSSQLHDITNNVKFSKWFSLNWYLIKSSQKRPRRSSYINPGICAHCSYRNTYENGGTIETFTETVNQGKTQQEVWNEAFWMWILFCAVLMKMTIFIFEIFILKLRNAMLCKQVLGCNIEPRIFEIED